jgi:hypothetical protein
MNQAKQQKERQFIRRAVRIRPERLEPKPRRTIFGGLVHLIRMVCG